MSDQIEFLEQNVRIGFVGKRGPAWWAENGGAVDSHYTGPVPLEVARELLGWEPVKVTLMEEGDDGMARTLRDWRGRSQVAVKNPRNNAMLGVFGEDYPTTTYRERLLDGLESILDDSLETMIGSCGLLDGGGKAWVQIETPNNIVHESGEQFRPYITAYSSMDGTTANTFKEGCTRVVCDNTFSMMKRENSNSYKYKNTSNGKLVVATAKQCLDLLHNIGDEISKDLEAMLARPVSGQQFGQILEAVIPTPEKDGRGKTIAQNKQLAIGDLYVNDPRVNVYTGTQWGVLQAFSTWGQHVASTKGDDSDAERTARKRMRGEFDTLDLKVREISDLVLAN